KLPLKKMKVNVLPDLKVVPGGQSIGVQLKAKGVLVVGHHRVGQDRLSPGARADIRVGDYILSMDGESVRGVQDVARIVKKAGDENRPVKTVIQRDEQKKQVMLNPVKDSGSDVYRIGLYVRDSAAGVGTLTFYDPNKKRYGALGHVIT